MEQTQALTLQSVGRAYIALSKELAAAWGPGAIPWGGNGPFSPFRLEDDLFRLDVLEGVARRVFRATGCVFGKAGCGAELVRLCDVCTEKRGGQDVS